MRAPMQFTTRAIEALDLEPGEKDVWVWDVEGSGLGLRMRRGKGGTTKRWYVAYQYAGADKRLPLAALSSYKLADARHGAYLIRRAAAEGRDPHATIRTAKLERRSWITALQGF